MIADPEALLEDVELLLFGYNPNVSILLHEDVSTTLRYWEGCARDWVTTLRQANQHRRHEAISSSLSSKLTLSEATELLLMIKPYADGRVIGDINTPT